MLDTRVKSSTHAKSQVPSPKSSQQHGWLSPSLKSGVRHGSKQLPSSTQHG